MSPVRSSTARCNRSSIPKRGLRAARLSKYGSRRRRRLAFSACAVCSAFAASTSSLAARQCAASLTILLDRVLPNRGFRSRGIETAERVLQQQREIGTTESHRLRPRVLQVRDELFADGIDQIRRSRHCRPTGACLSARNRALIAVMSVLLSWMNCCRSNLFKRAGRASLPTHR